MSSESPNAVLCDINGNELSVQNATAIPANTPALIAAGSDGTNSRYITLDTSGRQIVVGAAAAGAAAAGNPNLVAGNVTTLAPTGYSNATVNYFSLDTSGNLRVTGVGGTFPNASLAVVGAGVPADVTSMGALTATNNPLCATGIMEPLSMNLYGSTRVANSPASSPIIIQPYNSTITTSGGLSFYDLPVGPLYMSIYVGNAPTGSSPTLQYTIYSEDPTSQNLFNGVNSVVISTAGQYNFQYNNLASSAVAIIWTVGGGSPSFTGVSATIIPSNGAVGGLGSINVAPVGNPVLVGGQVTTAAPTGYTTGTVNYFSLDTSGNLRVTGSGNFNNASVGPTGSAAPADITSMGALTATNNPLYTAGVMEPLSMNLFGSARVASSPSSSPIIVQNNATLTTNSSASYYDLPVGPLYISVYIANAPTGTTPTLQYSVQSEDPTSTSLFPPTVLGPVISAAGQYNFVYNNATSSAIAIFWTLGGSSPSFTGVFVTIIPSTNTVGYVTTAAPTYVTGTTNNLSLDTAGNLRVTGSGGTFTNPSVGLTASAPPADATYVGALVTATMESSLISGDMYPFNLTTTGLLRIDGAYPSGTATATAVDMSQVGGLATTTAPTYSTATVNPLSLTAVGGQLRVDGVYPAGTTNANSPDVGNVGGYVTTAAPGYSTGNLEPLSLDTVGNLRVTGVGGTFPNASLAGVGSGIGADVTSMGALTANNNPTYFATVMEPLSMNLYGNVRVAAQPGIWQDFIQTNATITTGNNQQVFNLPIGTVYIQVDIINSPTGTLPTLQYNIQGIDPQFGTPITPQVFGPVMSAAGVYVFEFNNTTNGVYVNWTVGGTTPSFTGVYTTLIVSPSVTSICAQTPEATTSWNSGTTVNTASTINVAGYNTVAVTLLQTTTITGGVVTFEVSDTFAGTNWYPINTISANNTYTLVASTNASFQINISGFVQFRVRLSTVITGTAAVTVGIAASTATADTAFTSINNATSGYSTLGALNSTVVLYTPGLQSVGMQLSAGTFIGTLVAETTYDNGVTWNSVSFINNSTNLTSTQLVFATANGAVGATISEVGGAAETRVRVSAYTSGTVQCLLSASNIAPHLPVAIVDLYGNAARISMLGSQLVNQPYCLVGTNFVGTTIDASFWTSSVIGTGTAAQTGGIVTLTTGATNPSDAALTSSRLARYIPGNPNRFRSVILIPTVVITGSTRTWGAYNSTTQPTPTDGFAFSLSAAGVLSVNCYNAGTPTTVVSGSFNGQIANSSTGFTTGGTFTMDTNVHTYEIMYIEDIAQFYIDKVLIHTFTAAATPLSSTFNLKFNAVAAGTGTTASMQIWTGLILRDGLAETSPNFSNLGVTAGTQLKLGPGNLQRIILNATSSATTVSVYDAIGAATLPIALISTPAGATPNQLQYEVDFVLGLWIVITGASSNVTVIYE